MTLSVNQPLPYGRGSDQSYCCSDPSHCGSDQSYCGSDPSHCGSDPSHDRKGVVLLALPERARP